MLFDIKRSSRPHLPHTFCQGEEIRVVSYERSKGGARTFLFFLQSFDGTMRLYHGGGNILIKNCCALTTIYINRLLLIFFYFC